MDRLLSVFIALSVFVTLTSGAAILQDTAAAASAESTSADLQTSETFWGGWGGPWGWDPGYRGGPGGWGGWGIGGGWGAPWGYGWGAPWASGYVGFGPFGAGVGLGRYGGWW